MNNPPPPGGGICPNARLGSSTNFLSWRMSGRAFPHIKAELAAEQGIRCFNNITLIVVCWYQINGVVLLTGHQLESV